MFCLAGGYYHTEHTKNALQRAIIYNMVVLFNIADILPQMPIYCRLRLRFSCFQVIAPKYIKMPI